MINTNFAQSIDIDFQNISTGNLEAIQLVLEAYSLYASNEYVLDNSIGFNNNSCYTYIALENGISICSKEGKDVEYIVFDFETGEEYFLETNIQAENKLN